MFPSAAIYTPLVMLACEARERYGVSLRDAAILTAAESLGARVLYSEDFSDG